MPRNNHYGRGKRARQAVPAKVTPNRITEENIDLSVPEHLVAVGLALRDQNELEPAKACLLRAIGLQHDHADAHLGLAEVLLASGEYEQGFMEYQWRMRSLAGRAIQVPTMTSAPWNGMRLPASRLLLICDQGFGDSIQFVRYVPEIKRLGLVHNIVVACGMELAPLIERVEGVDACYSRWSDVPEHAVHALMSDLPYLMHTTIRTVPWRGRYIGCDLPRPAAASRMGFRRIGLVWSGRPTPGNSRLSCRAMPLAALAPLVLLPSCEFVSLQKPLTAEDAALLASWRVPDLGSTFESFADTAAVISTLDYVVTIDTAAAHLAGAMGANVMVLVPFSSDWRWMNGPGGNADSMTPWYPHTNVYRQQAAGDWDSAVAQVCAALGADAR